ATGGRNWQQISPDLSREIFEVPGTIGKFRDQETAKPTRRGVIYTVAPSYVDINRIWAGTDDGLIHVTADGGANWKNVAATERQVYVSFNDGENWQSLKLNMPATSVRDLILKDDDLVVATHGRGFWILDDISPLRELTAQTAVADAVLFKPSVAYRVRWNTN